MFQMLLGEKLFHFFTHVMVNDMTQGHGKHAQVINHLVSHNKEMNRPVFIKKVSQHWGAYKGTFNKSLNKEWSMAERYTDTIK